MKILIAEDNLTDRLILKSLLSKLGHQVIEAENGEQALEKFTQESPDLILLDAIMPILDGFQVAKKIRNLSNEQYVPIIFITSLKETESFLKCMQAGADDFFTKPFNRIMLEAKISAFSRTQTLYQTIAKQRDEIRFHTDHLIQEQQVAKRIFDNIAHKGALGEPFIKYSASPMSVFNGDILLAAKRPLGGLNVMLGDFTGHGLSASIGAMPTADIFFGMTAKGFELFEIIQEINMRLYLILPTGYFCCAVIAQLDFDLNSMQFWNGGMPDAFVINRDSGEVDGLPSTHLPLGILEPSKFQTKVEIRSFNDGDSLLMFSDGIIEATNKNQEMFGMERMQATVRAAAKDNRVFEHIGERLAEFRCTLQQGDDLTFVEIKNHKELSIEICPEVSEEFSSKGPSDSSFSLELGPESLKHFNPLPIIAQFLSEIGNLRSYRTQILTILTELFSNALEHGVLELDSKLKRSPDGFADYYRRRSEALKKLESGFIRLEVTHQSHSDGGVLTIKVSDSGKGFDYKALKSTMVDQALMGRGYPLVARLAESIEFSKGGSSVKVLYHWKANTRKP